MSMPGVGPSVLAAVNGPELAAAANGPELAAAANGPELATAANGPELATAANGPELAAVENFGSLDQADTATDAGSSSPASENDDDSEYDATEDEDETDSEDDYEENLRKKKRQRTNKESRSVETTASTLLKTEEQEMLDSFDLTWEILSEDSRFTRWCANKEITTKDIEKLKKLRRQVKNRLYSKNSRKRAKDKIQMLMTELSRYTKPGNDTDKGPRGGNCFGMVTSSSF